MRKPILLIVIVALIAALLCACNNDKPNPSAETESIQQSSTEPDATTPDNYPTNTEISFSFVDHHSFTKYWTDGIFRCGTDIDEGDYFIISIYGANALYDVSDNPNDFSWSDYWVFRRVTVKNGQYVNIEDGALLIRASEFEDKDLTEYGIYLVGKDLPAGDYQIKTITDKLSNDIVNISGITGAFQISEGKPEKEPVSCSPLFDSQSYLSVTDGQYVIINDARMVLVGSEKQNDSDTNKTEPAQPEITEPEQTSISVEQAYNTAINLTRNDLTRKSEGGSVKYYFKNLPGSLLQEDVDWLENSINKDGTVNQGAIYRKMAKLLDGYSSHIANYKDFSDVLIGFVPETVSDFDPYAQNAMTFICSNNSLKEIMKALETVSCVSGSFEYDSNTLGVYDFEISDLSICASEMKISQEMLGYTLAFLTEYAPEITFTGNACHISYVSMKKEADPLTADDFIVICPNDGITMDILQDYGSGHIQFFCYDAGQDPSKEGVVITNRIVHIGDSKQDVIDKYGEANTNSFVYQTNVVYQAMVDYDASLATLMRNQCNSYISYTYENAGVIEFYFDEDDAVSWIVFFVE